MRTLVIVLALCTLFAPRALAQTPVDDPAGTGLAAPIMNALNRVALSLDGPWNAIPDPYDTGSLTHLSEPRGDGWWLDRRRERPDQRIEYDFDAAETLEVPGDWNTQRRELFLYEGTLWYQREFAFEPKPRARQFLHFGAANRHATVWLNGERLGSHHAGFTPFAFEITGRLRPGQNSLVVRVDNRRRPEDVPAMRTDWWNYGGLTREVSLLEVPRTFIRSWETRLDEDGRLAVSLRLDGPDTRGRAVRIALPGLGLEALRQTDTRGITGAIFDLPPGAARWTPASPALHDLELELFRGRPNINAVLPSQRDDRGAEDTANDRVGLRTVATRGREILLNGEPVFLRGICLHEEAFAPASGAPAGGGRAWSEAHARELLGRAKDLGANYVRLAHYTHNEHMARVADELGLLVWAEIPVYWVLDFDNPATLAAAQTHLREMIERDRNRASVIIWSVGNENPFAGERGTVGGGRDIRPALARLARDLDPTRLVSAACFVRMTRGDDGSLERVIVEDPFGADADVLAINEYIGWYHDHTRQLEGVRVETAWEKPLLISEFGAGVKRGLRGGVGEVWTEEFAARFYADQLAWCDRLREAGLLQGVSPWILKDFRSPRRPLAGVQDWWNRKGLLDETGAEKDVFGVVGRAYRRWAEQDAR